MHSSTQTAPKQTRICITIPINTTSMNNPDAWIECIHIPRHPHPRTCVHISTHPGRVDNPPSNNTSLTSYSTIQCVQYMLPLSPVPLWSAAWRLSQASLCVTPLKAVTQGEARLTQGSGSVIHVFINEFVCVYIHLIRVG